jgi:3-dehydroquinate dehydratase-2
MSEELTDDLGMIYVINGPNLNLLGARQPELYGSASLADWEARARQRFPGLSQHWLQSNHEGQLIDWLHEARTQAAGLVLNAGAYSHTSYALYDALLALTIPKIEVHLTLLPARAEPFRHHSVLTAACSGSIQGLGGVGYLLALSYFCGHVSTP